MPPCLDMILSLLGEGLGYIAKQLRLQDKLPFLILLASLECLVILPSHCLVTLSAGDVADDVSARGHVALRGIASYDIDDVIEEVGLAMLAAEVLRACQSL